MLKTQYKEVAILDALSLDVLSPMIAAPFAGSFLGLLVHRLPTGRAVIFARSSCDHCGHSLGPLSLVPLLSFLQARGRCRYCAKPIAAFYPLIELAALGIVPPVALALGPDPFLLWAGSILGWCLLALAWIDWRHMILPDILTGSLLGVGLAATWVSEPEALADHLFAVAIGYVSLTLIALSYRRIRHREGLGRGDAKLLAAGGAWLGISGLAPVLFLGSAAALFAVLVGKALGATVDAKAPIPFGPWLSMAIWLCWLAQHYMPW